MALTRLTEHKITYLCVSAFTVAYHIDAVLLKQTPLLLLSYMLFLMI
jgi:hypothetical protein